MRCLEETVFSKCNNLAESWKKRHTWPCPFCGFENPALTLCINNTHTNILHLSTSHALLIHVLSETVHTSKYGSVCLVNFELKWVEQNFPQYCAGSWTILMFWSAIFIFSHVFLLEWGNQKMKKKFHPKQGMLGELPPHWKPSYFVKSGWVLCRVCFVSMLTSHINKELVVRFSLCFWYLF